MSNRPQVNTNNRRISIRAYRDALSQLLEATSLPIASEVCFKLWDGYIANGIYLDLEYVKADIARAEGHFTNPPAVLPEEGIDINPGSKCFAFNLCNDQERGCIKQTDARLASHLTVSEMLLHKNNALSLIRLFGRYNPYFGKRCMHA